MTVEERAIAERRIKTFENVLGVLHEVHIPGPFILAAAKAVEEIYTDLESLKKQLEESKKSEGEA